MKEVTENINDVVYHELVKILHHYHTNFIHINILSEDIVHNMFFDMPIKNIIREKVTND